MKKGFWIYCLIFYGLPVFASNDRALFWEVTSATNNEASGMVYLLGSIHFADDSFYPLRRKIEESYDASDHLVVEINTADIEPGRYQKIISERGEYKDDESLGDHITPATMLSLKRQLNVLGVSDSVIGKSKPGVLAMTISMIQVLKLGFSPELGIDHHFLHKDKSKDVIELETLEDQLDLMINITDGDLLLRETLSSMEKSSELIHRMMSSWKEGDEVAMAKLIFDDAIKDYPSFSVIYDKLLFERNINMTKKIESFLKSDDVYFVVVGAGHLVGEKGIVRILENDDYRVRRL